MGKASFPHSRHHMADGSVRVSSVVPTPSGLAFSVSLITASQVRCIPVMKDGAIFPRNGASYPKLSPDGQGQLVRGRTQGQ